MNRLGKKVVFAGLAATLALATSFAPVPSTRAADHSEAPLADEDRPNDIGDLYAFLDPNDNTKMIFAFTLVGFIIPAEQVNQGFFDATSRYRLELEETGDAKADRFIDITFSKQTSRTMPQTATIVLPDGSSINAPTTVPTLSETPATPTVTTNANGVTFFGGVVDDPFFFDIPGFNRFVAKVLAHDGTAGQELQRGRDSFAGYDTLGVALSVPVSMLNFTNDVIGVDLVTQRQAKRTFKPNAGEFVFKGKYSNIDRMGNPAINTVLIPFARKDEYNLASTSDDAAGRFQADIVQSLTNLGTTNENIAILASVAVAKGDFLRVNRTLQNTGTGGGNNAEAAFPNGRRLGDDTIDTILFFVANQTALGDNVPSNDVALRDAFPFFGASQQPRPMDTADDNTRN